MTQFEKLVTNFIRELRELKSAPTRSPSEMVTKKRTITIYPTIIGYTGGNKLQTLPEKAGVAVITLDEPGFATVTLTGAIGQRKFYQRLRNDNSGNREFVCWLQYGSPDDASDLGGSTSNKKTVPVTVEVTATCDFTLTQYQTESWT